MATWKKIATTDDIVSPTEEFTQNGTTNNWTGAYDSSLSAVGNYYGENIRFGTAISFVAGKIYCFSSSGWVLADKGTPDHGTRILGVATGTTTTSWPTGNLLTKGIIKMSSVSGTDAPGKIVYLGDAGVPTATLPTSTGDIVRPIGYALDTTNNIMFFDPDKSWVELS